MLKRIWKEIRYYQKSFCSKVVNTRTNCIDQKKAGNKKYVPFLLYCIWQQVVNKNISDDNDDRHKGTYIHQSSEIGLRNKEVFKPPRRNAL